MKNVRCQLTMDFWTNCKIKSGANAITRIIVRSEGHWDSEIYYNIIMIMLCRYNIIVDFSQAVLACQTSPGKYYFYPCFGRVKKKYTVSTNFLFFYPPTCPYHIRRYIIIIILWSLSSLLLNIYGEKPDQLSRGYTK